MRIAHNAMHKLHNAIRFMYKFNRAIASVLS